MVLDLVFGRFRFLEYVQGFRKFNGGSGHEVDAIILRGNYSLQNHYRRRRSVSHDIPGFSM